MLAKSNKKIIAIAQMFIFISDVLSAVAFVAPSTPKWSKDYETDEFEREPSS